MGRSRLFRKYSDLIETVHGRKNISCFKRFKDVIFSYGSVSVSWTVLPPEFIPDGIFAFAFFALKLIWQLSSYKI